MIEFVVESEQRKVKRGYFVIDGERVEAKECTKCSIAKTYDNYSPNKTLYDGHVNHCNGCRAERQKDYAKANPEIRRKSEQKWRETNPDKVKEMSKRTREKHREGYSRRLREWKSRNKYKVDADTQRRRAIEKALPNNFDNDWADIVLTIYGGCAFTGDKDDLHWDHFIPLATGIGGTVTWNMIPLKSTINTKKRARNPLKFFCSPEYSENRLLDILAIQSFLRGDSIEGHIDFVNNAFKEEERVDVEEIKRKAIVRHRTIDAVSSYINVCRDGGASRSQ